MNISSVTVLHSRNTIASGQASGLTSRRTVNATPTVAGSSGSSGATPHAIRSA